MVFRRKNTVHKHKINFKIMIKLLKKPTTYFYTVLYAVFAPFYLVGVMLFYITRPFLALSHLLMWNKNTAKRLVTNWQIWKDVGDAF